MAIDAEFLLDGLERVGQGIELYPSPLAKLLGALLELGAETVKLETDKPDGDPVAVVASLRATLRAGMQANWQRAIDESEPKP